MAATVFVRRWLAVDTLLERAAETGAGLIVLGPHGQGPRRLTHRLDQLGGRARRDGAGGGGARRRRGGAAPARRGRLRRLAGSRSRGRCRRALVSGRESAGGERRRGRDSTSKRTRLLDRLAAHGVDPARAEAITLEGDPAAALLDFAETARADLLAIGRRGSTGLAGLLLGSVSEKLLQLAACPLLVAH